MSFRAATAVAFRPVCSGILLIAAAVGVTIGQARARTRMQAATADLEKANAQAVRHAGLLQAILDSSNDGIAVVDQHGETIMQNPAAEALLGALDDSQTNSGKPPYGIYHPDELTLFAPDELPVTRALAGESSEQVPMLIRNAANPAGVVISICAHPLCDPRGEGGAVAVFHDVTALRQREADLAAFAGVVAHDLKSPLTAIVGYTEVIRDEVDDLPEAARPMLDRMLAASTRMNNLIDDLLTYASARDRTLEATQLDLRPLVQEILSDRFSAAAVLAPDAPAPQGQVGPMATVHADPVMIRQLLDNLIGNALKYTPPGQPARIEISTTSAGPGWVRVEIADHGIGIPAGQHHAIFENFHRAHRGGKFAGTGLGLAICHRIVKRHQGDIGAQDNPGGGARFWFTLPTGQAETPPEGELHAHARRSVSAMALEAETSG
jgi:signal transduction histidine kinase